MSPKIKIFHNPKCSKSRATLQLLEEHNLEPLIIKYLEEPMDKDTIENILKKLGKEPREIMRKTEQPYELNGLKDKNLTRPQLIEAIIQNPILMERPIVLTNTKAAIGRPPETVLKIL
jgi:arsenate reductase